MNHIWFPTRKASELTFFCFHLAGWQPFVCFQLARNHWKQTNVSFEAFLVGNQELRIKRLISYPKNIFRFIQPVHVHLKTDNVDYLKKPPWKKLLQSMYQVDMENVAKCVRLFWLFQCSRNQPCHWTKMKIPYDVSMSCKK